MFFFDNACQKGALIGKIGRIASENVVMQVIKFKCVPLLLYAVDACPNVH